MNYRFGALVCHKLVKCHEAKYSIYKYTRRGETSWCIRRKKALFAFLWKNKTDKIKRLVLFRPLSKGGLCFRCFRTTGKALRLSWISRLLSNSNDNWTAIPNHHFEKYRGLLFLLNCNHSTNKLDKKIPLFYWELLEYFKELRSNYKDPLKREFI